MLVSICIIIILIYLILIGWLNNGFNKIKDFKLQDLKPKTKFSIVIPFRNEAENLTALLKSIDNLNYPNSHFEVILVDDESEDTSVEIINKVLDTFRQKSRNTRTDIITIINNNRTSDSPKKDAITSAIKIAKYNWIITTDADCTLPKYWLDSYDEFIQTNNTLAIAGPVKFTGLSSFFTRFQILDSLSLQGATIGSFGIKKPLMCNGANFAYSKKGFEQVNGFEDNNRIASGDDVFLLQKLSEKDISKIHFLKSENAIVTTRVTNGFTEYLQQRLRWASKTTNYKYWFPKFLGLIVLLTNLVMVSVIPLYILEILQGKTAVLLFLIKFSIDLLLIFKTARFYKQESVLLSYVFASFIYPFITIYITAILPFLSFKWKGRTFKR
ncbi:glycosyltransferase [Winogradskyella sp.]|uniref:glycosyltransferase n=1 Tax=Winogradskyella sp. TaxID=1883156 RepID=UPI0035C7972A